MLFKYTRLAFLFAFIFAACYNSEYNHSSKLNAQVLKPIKWEITTEKINDAEHYLVFKANISPGWTVYSQYTSDDGPVPTTITYEEKSGIDLIGKAQEFGYKKEGPDALFDSVIVVKFLDKQPFIIKQKVKVKDYNKPISGYLTFMTCDNKRCLPPEDIDFSLKLENSTKTVDQPGQTNNPVVTKTDNTDQNPNAIDKADDSKKDVKLDATVPATIDSNGQQQPGQQDTSKNVGGAYVSSAKIENGVIDQLIPNLFNTYKNPKSDCGVKEVSQGYFWTFITGFSGGLFAILTPCVFPMIPITVSFFTKDSKRKAWLTGLIYGLSIIVIYVVLGLLVTILFGPEALNNLAVNWIANTFFFLIFLFFAFSFFGYYELTLPSNWSTKTDKLADQGGLLGIFFMAFTLAIVSFSCTGPIIGSALVTAGSKGQYLGPFIVMFGFSLALALPFGLFAIFPSWLNSLPKSGGWMNSVKVILGFIELALALKFLSVADTTMNWGILKYELFMVLWVVIGILSVLYLLGMIKFPHDSVVKKLSPGRWSFVLLFCLITVYVGLGFRFNKVTNSYMTPSLLSGIVPPANYNYLIKDIAVDDIIKAKYVSYTKCANNINCFKDYYEGLSYAREAQKPLFIDFTGFGCQNCRKTEDQIWVDDQVRKQLNDDFVLVSLYVDYKKDLPQTLISKTRGTKIRNVGNLWADFQIVNFEQNSQPLYIVVDPKTETVLTKPRPYDDNLQGYRDYLDCGLNAYK